MLSKQLIKKVCAKLRKSAKFDETVDCIVVFKNKIKTVEVGNRFFSDTRSRYLIGCNQNVAGYISVSVDEFNTNNYDSDVTFFARREDFARVMKSCGLKIYKLRKKLNVLQPDNDKKTVLLVNKRSLIFRVSKLSELKEVPDKLLLAYEDLAKSEQPISKLLLKTTMGCPQRVI